MKYTLAKALLGRVGISVVCIGAGHYAYTTFLEPLVGRTTHHSPSAHERLSSSQTGDLNTATHAYVLPRDDGPERNPLLPPITSHDIPSEIRAFLSEARYVPR